MAIIRGSGLASSSASSDVTPLPTNVNGTRVLVGGVEAPLYFVSDDQIRARYFLEPALWNWQYQVLVSANGALTVPDPVALSAAQPGLRVSDADSRAGGGNIPPPAPISSSDPAKPGEEIILYLAGMGQTEPPVRSGAAAPSGSLSKALTQPAVSIDGQPAEVVFAGLTPGSVGLYQINLRVPADAKSGDLAVQISQGGAQSNPGVLAVR